MLPTAANETPNEAMTDCPVPVRPPAPPVLSADGLVVEYMPGRLYLGAYSEKPDDSTPFPFAKKEKKSHRRGLTKSHKSTSSLASTASQKEQGSPIYFTVDDEFYYNRFFHDFGPFHIGHIYRFSCCLHDLLKENEVHGRPVVFYSRTDPRSRSNAACLLSCYMILVQSWSPHLALAPIAQIDPPLMPFRDAGYSKADFMITIQDIAYGVWRAKEKGLFDFREFEIDEYELYERVDQGDFNWISPDFVAFASPIYPIPPPPDPKDKNAVQLQYTEEYLSKYVPKGGFPRSLSQIHNAKLPTAFNNVLEHFVMKDVGLVVRLNSHLYPAKYFSALGITHMDMIFEDGTVPPLKLLRKFIRLAHEIITVKKKKIAVHCKAGLGRTGCLIGAYLIYRYGFSANEVIAYMRFQRPGMVVGPQQHWLHLHQNDIRAWWQHDRYAEERESLLNQLHYYQNLQTTPTKKSKTLGLGNLRTPPSRRPVLGEITHNDASPSKDSGGHSLLPVPTPGQPRKNLQRFNLSPRHFVRKEEENKMKISKEAEIAADDLSEEEYHLQVTAKARASRSPTGDKRRSVSYTITASGSKVSAAAAAAGGSPPSAGKSGNGLTSAKVRSSPRRNNSVKDGGIRKVSGRVGSHSGGTPGKAL